jgi:hypothetical protein
VAKKKEEESLYRVFRADNGELAYLPGSGDGLSLEEAQRLSDGLVIDTEVYPTYVPDEE